MQTKNNVKDMKILGQNPEYDKIILTQYKKKKALNQYLETTYPTKSQYVKYKNNSQNSPVKK